MDALALVTWCAPAQHDHYTGRRKDIWEALHPEPSRDYSLESYEADEDGCYENNSGTDSSTHPSEDSLGRKKTAQQAKALGAGVLWPALPVAAVLPTLGLPLVACLLYQ